jgi:hypothetical protein
MKKLLAIALTSILMVSTIGITVHKHYCASSLVTTSILPHEDDTCDSTNPMANHSCEDQHQHFSVDSPLVLVAMSFDLSPSIEWIKVLQSEVTVLLSENLSTTKVLADISPPPSEPNIYTRVQSFLL